ncbi:MAG: MBL fold metallo-hydrolase, partial [Clostridia bacterium]|nr:MBL fold metallo-hydrolase [Clostridia bacterium]
PGELIQKLPVLEGLTPVIEDTGDDCYMLRFGKGNSATEKLNSYKELLVNNGYELYAENVIEGNEYSTYVNDELVVTTIYTKWNKMSKILVEWKEDTELPAKAEEIEYTPIEGLKSSITQIGLYYDSKVDENKCMTNINGMCYVIRLADGSFIVVDGGHAEVQADNIYTVLKAQAPDEDNITIAAWFFSHNHGDHIGFFPSFVSKYSDKVTVERFIFNFPSKEQGGHTPAQDTLRGLIKSNFKGAKMIKAHPGQVFNIRNAKITMLYTTDVFENSLSPDTNNASIVWRMELEGNSFMCLGDYSESAFHLLNLYTAETLGSDIVQVAHHGISGMSRTVYETITPEYALWPVAALYVRFYNNNGNPVDVYLDGEGNSNTSYFLDGTMDKNKVFVAADDITVLTLVDGTVSTNDYDDITAFLANYKKIY